MRHTKIGLLALLVALVAFCRAAEPERIEQKKNIWVKRSPLEKGPVSPALGYEGAFAYDPRAGVVIRFGGHNQGGGGEQNAETWTYNPISAEWKLKEPNTSPPGVCCAQQNVLDLSQNRFLRFRSFSGSHGWHWFRENYLTNTGVWNYDLATNTWRNPRALPEPGVRPLRCAAWDTDHQVVVIFGGEGSNEGTVVYDPHVNRWTRMSPKEQPAPRSSGNLAYDEARKLHVLFGSQFSDDPHTWIYDLRKNEWRDARPKTQPPTDRNDAVLAYDANAKRVLAVVRAVDKRDKDEVTAAHLETWAYDAGKNEWTRMNPAREPDGQGGRRRIMVAIPDQNVILMEAYVNPTEKVKGVDREQQIWTYRLAERQADPRPPAPTDVRVSTTANGATLTWKPVAEASYTVHRGTGKEPWLVDYRQVARLDKGTTSFADKDLKGEVYHYFVRAVDAKGNTSADSLKVRTQPRIVEDAVVSVLGPKQVELSWLPPAGFDDSAGYQVERAVVDVLTTDQIVRLKKDTEPLPEPNVGSLRAIGPFQTITTELVKEPRFTDTAIDLSRPVGIDKDPVVVSNFPKDQLDGAGKPYRFAVHAYRIRAVNKLGVAGGDSPYFLTIPSAPQHVFSKEDGTSGLLKWVANKEKGLKGYRVYRMESPKINGPGQKVTRVTAEPLAATTFTDPAAGKVTRRYWIVAVDALGQEGLPSAPAWHYREWARFYSPFVGDWHQ